MVHRLRCGFRHSESCTIDLGLAFDTVDHGVLLDVLRKKFGIQDDSAPYWIDQGIISSILGHGVLLDVFRKKFGIQDDSALYWIDQGIISSILGLPSHQQIYLWIFLSHRGVW